jgi:hypothetical protein
LSGGGDDAQSDSRNTMKIATDVNTVAGFVLGNRILFISLPPEPDDNPGKLLGQKSSATVIR